MSAPRLLAPTTISGGVPTAGAGTLNTIALWTPDGNTLGNSLLTQSGSIVTNASGAIRAAGTTQTSPAFTRHDTTTSGIYFPATNEIGFTISNQHAMFISSGRNVGIGTTSPSAQLHISRAGGTSNAEYIRLTNTTVATNSACGITFFQNNAAVPVNRIEGTVSAAGSYDLVSYAWNGSSTAEVMRLQGSTGNVGIGTASPSYKLDVISAEARIGASAPGANTFLYLGNGVTSAGPYGVGALQFSGQAHTAVFANSGYGAARASLGMVSGGVYTPALSADPSGNVGIGTASPSYKLTIENSDSAAYTSTTQASPMASVRNTYGAAGNTQAVLAHSTANYSSVWNVGLVETGGGAYTGAYIWQNRTGAATWAERARIDSAGNFGIGTASPQEKLQIYGDLKVGVLASGSFVTLADETSTQKNVGIARLAGDTGLTVAGYGGIRFYASTTQVTSQVERMRISNAGTQAQSQVAIGTSSFTSGRALTTVADLDVFGVRVGRGGDGSQTSNTALGRSALGSITTGDSCTAVGSLALQSVTGSRNTAVGYAALGAIGASTDNTALGASAIGNNTGSRNTAVGRNALNGSAGASTGSDNVCIGERAGDSITTGASNIVIGSNADLAAATDSNKLVIGDATNYVATNGGATTYYATAGALAGYIIVRLNGTDVKLPVYAL